MPLRYLLLPALLLIACGQSESAPAPAAAPSATTQAATQPAGLTLRKLPDRVRVELDGQLFTEYRFTFTTKPVLYPIIGPTGACLVRHWPLEDGFPNQPHDHPHHESFWYGHGSVNGKNFWLNDNTPHGSIVQDTLDRAEVVAGRAVIATTNTWRGPDGKPVLTDQRQVELWADAAPTGARYLQFTITLRASAGDVTFGDDKDGVMAIRTHPNLALRNNAKDGTTTAAGKALNSEGVTGPAVWGKRAKWVDYWGPIDGQTVGVALFDHPANPRYPTWWMARDYGFVGANPFGISAYEKKPPHTGDFKIPAGQSVTFRYLFVFHVSDAKQAKIAERWEQWAR